MIVTFSELINEVIRALGLDSETIDPAVLTSIKLRINEAQDVIFYDQDWEWRKRRFSKTTRAPYETGTISVTKNSRTVTGSGTTWTDSMKEGYVLLNGRDYKISEIVNSTSLKLTSPFDKDTASGASYKIIFPDITLNHEISAITNVWHNGSPITPKHINKLSLFRTSTSLPLECAMAGGTIEDFYSVGTVAVTSGSSTVTGTGTTWTDSMEGRSFFVREFARMYTIKTVSSSTSLTLTENYDGDDGTGKSYAIDPKGTQLLTFRDTPDDNYFIDIEALIKPVKLINNNDISLIPNHVPLIRTSIWLAVADMEAKNPVRIQQARADAERTIKQLRDSYKVITNVTWKDNKLQQYANRFDPLRRGR